MRSALADDFGEIILRVIEFVDQAFVALGLFERRQILPLHVFNQAEFERFAIRQFAQDRRHFVKTNKLRRSPAPFAGDDLVSIRRARDRAHEQGFKNAAFADRIRQTLQCFFIEIPARLESARLHREPARYASRRAFWRCFLPLAWPASPDRKHRHRRTKRKARALKEPVWRWVWGLGSCVVLAV